MTDPEWARCAPWIIASMSRSGQDHTLEDAEALVRCGLAQFWPFTDSVLITQVHDESEGRSLHVWIGGGSLREILGVEPIIAQWARAAGCMAITLEGRSGWRRALEKAGYRDVGGTLRKDL